MTKYGPHNPHPLSTMRTELVWEGKYDEFGNRREVNVAGLSMPLQRIETIDEPRSRAEAQGSLFDEQKAHRDDFRNRLIWGDNQLVAASLLEEFRGAIDLVYIDPPFDVGADFSMGVSIGDDQDKIEKAQSTLEMVAYRDIWGRGTDSYLHMIHNRAVLIRELLSEHGLLFLHVGWFVSHFVKSILDDIFGGGHFVNQIIWKRQSAHSDIGQGATHLGRLHDVILVYSKSDNYTWNMQYEPYSKEYADTAYKHKEPETGRRFRIDNTSGPGGARKGNPFYEFRGTSKYWRYSRQRIEQLFQEGRLVQSKKGGDWGYKRYLDEMPGVPLQDLWLDIPAIQSQSREATGYDTQKPEKLLERIISLGSNEHDLVADFFMGSGTTPAVAEKLGRRWIGCDLGRFAVHTSRKRLIDIQRNLHEEGTPYRSFDVYNLGRYERQWWQSDALRGADDEHRKLVVAVLSSRGTQAGSVAIVARS